VVAVTPLAERVAVSATRHAALDWIRRIDENSAGRRHPSFASPFISFVAIYMMTFSGLAAWTWREVVQKRGLAR
jgi:hypothetical protein